jgi:hypothetical protein
MRDHDSQTIQQGLEGAFRPLRCVVEIWDYGDKLRFKVFSDKDEAIVGMPEVLVRTIREPASLNHLIQQVREKILVKGYDLDPI